jgi:hypothetical protein
VEVGCELGTLVHVGWPCEVQVQCECPAVPLRPIVLAKQRGTEGGGTWNIDILHRACLAQSACHRSL